VRTAHLRRGVGQCFEVELLADELADHFAQMLVGIERVAGKIELLDAHLERRRYRQRGSGLRRTRGNTRGNVFGGRRGKAQRLARLLEHASGIGALLGQVGGHLRNRDRAGDRKHDHDDRLARAHLRIALPEKAKAHFPDSRISCSCMRPARTACADAKRHGLT
jgi:hypothetical protein